jgi:hypothetical protein
MNKVDSKPSFQAALSSPELDEYMAEGIRDPAPHLNPETIALYREIYRLKLTRREPRFWARLLEWARKASRKDQCPAPPNGG